MSLININNRSFHDHLRTIYPPELTFKEATKTSTSAYHLDLLLNVTDGSLSIKLCDKRGYFDFRIVHFPYICSDKPEYHTTCKIPKSSSYCNFIGYPLRSLLVKVISFAN